jgi:hypothetical protein
MFGALEARAVFAHLQRATQTSARDPEVSPLATISSPLRDGSEENQS